jgi:hypothetical protein
MKVGRSAFARIVTAIASLALAAEGNARATEPQETKRVCAEAANLGQELRDQGRYREAQDLLTTCSASTCPRLVQESCVRWLGDLRAAMPQVVIGAQDANGRDLTDVNVFIDGAPLGRALDGSARSADPGPHTLRFEAPNRAPIEERIVLRSGEKNRVIVLKFPPVARLGNERSALPLAASASPELTGLSRPRAAGLGGQRILGIAAGAVGIAGVAAASVFGVLALSASSAQKNECATSADCNNHAQALSDHMNATTDANIATVGFIAGGALIVGGLLLLVTARRPSERSAGFVVTPSVGPGGGWITLQARF